MATVKNDIYPTLKFGKLTVVQRIGSTKFGEVIWECVCDCGNFRNVNASKLRSGQTINCRVCARKERIIKITTHGKTNTRLYNIYRNMKARCYKSGERSYKDYGARGIKVCEEWLDDFQVFYDWAMSNGYDENLTIDRINSNGNYEPNNCRWADTKTQNRNSRRCYHKTEDGQLWIDIAKKNGIKDSVYWIRVRRGWSRYDAATKPQRSYKQKRMSGDE